MSSDDRAGPFPAERLLDPGALDRLRLDVGAASIGVLLAAFRTELERRSVSLRQAIDAGDAASIASTTHAIKGSALTFGAHELGAASSRANALARAADPGAGVAGEAVLGLIGPTLAEVARRSGEAP